MANSVDLLTYTYQTLIPQAQSAFPAKSAKLKGLVEESSLLGLFSKEGELRNIAAEAGNVLPLIQTLFKARCVLLACEVEILSLDQAGRVVNFISSLKDEIQIIDAASCVEDLISNLDQTIANASLEQLSEWARLVKLIPASLGSHDSFLPILSVRLKSLIWSKMPTETMAGHIDLAKTLLECTAYKDLELNDLVDIIVDHCLDHIETVNDFFGIEKMQNNPVVEDPDGSRELLGCLKQIDIINKDLKARFEALEGRYGASAPVRQQAEIRMNEVKNQEEFKLTDKIFYSHNDIATSTETIVRGGVLNNGTFVAVKIYTTRNKENLAKYKDEIQALMALSSQRRCFLQFYGAIYQENSVFIITEACDRTLHDDIAIRKRENRPFTVDERISIMSELLDGFTFMSYKKIYHQDIKPQNIMITAQNIIKIIDFNITIQTEDIETTSSVTNEYSIQGTKSWMSPEVLEGFLNNVERNQNVPCKYKLSKSDIFSLGLVFLKICILDDFNGLNQRDRNGELQELVRTRVEPEPLRSLIGKMLLLDPAQRPSFRKALGEVPGSTTRAN